MNVWSSRERFSWSVADNVGAKTLCLVLAAALLLPGGLVLPASAAASTITIRASVLSGTPGAEANGASEYPAMTPDGRYIVFHSIATNLVADDTSGHGDVFIRDTVTGGTERVSLTNTGGQADGPSSNPSVSNDGRYVAFQSTATNLVTGDTNLVSDIYVRDRFSGTTTRVSVAGTNTQANGASSSPAISGDGMIVAFDSQATNLVSSDTNQARDVFVRTWRASPPATTRVSVTSVGAQSEFQKSSRNPSISDSGQHVAFESDATNLVTSDTNGKSDIFVRDRSGPSTTRVSITSGGSQSNDHSQNSAISGNGSVVAFESYATNLATGDTNGHVDVFARGRTGSPSTHRVSIATGVSGAQANMPAFRPAISFDGRYVSFDSAASNLAAGDTNGLNDVFVRDRTSTTTTRASVSSAGAQADNTCWSSALSDDGLTVAFHSPATNLVSGDTNGSYDVFVSTQARIPTGTITISGGAAYTNVATVTVTHTVDWRGGGVGQMRHSIAGGAWGAWEGYAPTKQVTLTGPDGQKSVRVQFRDGMQTESDIIEDSVVLDREAPTGTIAVNSGAPFTTTTNVTLTHTATDALSGVSHMRHSTNGGSTWSAWELYAASKPFTLPAGDGAKTVRVEFRDSAGNSSQSVIQDSIVLDTAGPSAPVVSSSTHNSQTTWYAHNDVMLNWTESSDTHSGISGYSFSWSTDPVRQPDGEIDVPGGAVRTMSYPDQPDGVYYFKVRAKDSAGNLGPVVSRTMRIGILGATRFDTAVTASRRAYPDGLTAPAGKRYVIIATGHNWPDALGGAALAGVLDGPILLVEPASVPDAVDTEITRLGADRAIIVGGTGAVSTAVERELNYKLGDAAVTRIDGTNRYETADKIALRVIAERAKLPGGYDGTAFVATGGNFPDALAAAPLAAAKGWPLFLADPTSGLTKDTKAAMAGVTRVRVLGGTGVVGPATYTYLARRFADTDRLAGAGRYDTAVAIASWGVGRAGLGWDRVGIATGENYPDALAGGVLQGKMGSVMVLTLPTTLHSATASALTANAAAIDHITFFGGTGAVSDAVRAAALKAAGM